MAAVLAIHTRHQLHVLPAPLGTDPAALGASVHVRCHRHRHHAVRIRRSQRVVVHHVVGLVVVHVGLQRVPRTRQVALLEARGVAGAFERGTVHAAPRVACDRIAGTGRNFQQRIGIRRPADRHVTVPLAPLRWHHIAVAVLVVIGFGTVATGAHIAGRVAQGQVQHLVVAVARTDQRTGIGTQARFLEARCIAFEAHGAGRGTCPPAHALRALDDGQAVEALRCDVGQRVVHARGAGADQVAVIAEDVQARTQHAAQHRVTVGAAVADGGEARNGLQVVGAVTGRDRLPRQAWIGHPVQWRRRRGGGDHQRIESARLFGGRGMGERCSCGQAKGNRQAHAGACGAGSHFHRNSSKVRTRARRPVRRRAADSTGKSADDGGARWPTRGVCRPAQCRQYLL